MSEHTHDHEAPAAPPAFVVPDEVLINTLRIEVANLNNDRLTASATITYQANIIQGLQQHIASLFTENEELKGSPDAEPGELPVSPEEVLEDDTSPRV